MQLRVRVGCGIEVAGAYDIRLEVCVKLGLLTRT